MTKKSSESFVTYPKLPIISWNHTASLARLFENIIREKFPTEVQR